MQKSNMQTVYYAGDIGYAFPAEEWNGVLELYWADPYAPYYQLADGRQFTVIETAYGDSTDEYENLTGYASDSGLLGIIRANQINRECLPTIEKMIKERGAKLLRIEADSVEDVIAKGLSPFGERVYTEEEFVEVEDII